MKGKDFFSRLGYAASGIASALAHEASFRFQLLAAFLAVSSTLWLNPPLVWIALIVVMVCLVLAFELFNTALEHALDGLHPDHAPFVRIAKDCAAAAVLLLSIASVAVYILMLFQLRA